MMNTEVKLRELAKILECLLFVAENPATIEDLCNATDASPDEIREALEELGKRLQNDSGLQLIRIAGGYQLCTKKEFADIIAKFLKPQKRRLSRATLEVLAIVAYKQPITAAEIQVIRGVQSDYSIRQLQERGLIQELERKNAPGRPILYGTTQEFLHQFGLNDLSELPSLNGKAGIEEIG